MLTTGSIYTEKLIWLLTGNFAKPGSQYLPSSVVLLGRDRGRPFDELSRSPVAGAPIIAGAPTGPCGSASPTPSACTSLLATGCA